MTIWELRFRDGRGASFYTAHDVTDDVGKNGVVRTIEVARHALAGDAPAVARECVQTRQVTLLTAHMGAVAYAVRHDP
jgi:hypothetical protein